MTRTTFRLLALVVLLITSFAHAEDAFYEVPRARLKVTDGEVSVGGAPLNQWSWRAPLPAYAVLDGEGEIYCLTPDMNAPQRWMGNDGGDEVLFVRAPSGKDVRGRLFVPNEKRDGMDALSFVIPHDDARAAGPSRFHEAKLIYYEYLLNRNVPGRAWWRHRAGEAAAALGEGARPLREQLPRRPQFGLDDTFALFAGTHAIDENLQLDRALRLGPAAGEKGIDIDTIAGITVKEFDWGPLVKGKKPEADPLASLIPSDQHALFLPSFEAVARLVDEGTRLGVETLGFAEPSGEDARTLERYQKQLCLPLNALTRFAGPRLMNGIALTGSDPYFRTGTDVAVLFQSEDARALHELLAAQVAAAREAHSAAKHVEGHVGGVPYAGAVSPDRSICAYVARLGDAVVVTNSLKQLERLVMTRGGDLASLASLPEYAFFRDRYRRGEGEETALLILSDATIRRWCGPRWRIADSRRTRAAAALSALQVKHHAVVVSGGAGESKLIAQKLMEGEDVRLESYGVTSSTFGHVGFMTPIVELDLERVTEAERDAYGRWRDTYQQNWRQFFDPIAVRVMLTGEKIATDVTVMPLIENTDYRQVIDLTRGVTLKPDAGEPHEESIIHLAVAVNEKSKLIDDWTNERQRALKEKILPWMGDTVAIYMDSAQKDAGDFPVALRIDSRDHAKLLEFLPAVQDVFAFVSGRERKFERRQYNGVAYVSAMDDHDEGRRGRFFFDTVHYVALPDALTVSWSEEVIRRAIDRHAARAEQARPARHDENQAPGTPAWLGSHVGLHVEPEFLKLLAGYGIGDYGGAAQRVSWANLPILNELKRLYPERDPVEVHERLFAVRPVCAAGGGYVWNERYRTMESTVVGHPAQPKAAPTLTSPMLEIMRSADFGLDFEHSGLRGRAVLHRRPADAKGR